MGKLCIEVTPTDKKAFISEELCIGCGICVKKLVLTNIVALLGMCSYEDQFPQVSLRSYSDL
jgi:translation initiation factor RLI1